MRSPGLVTAALLLLAGLLAGCVEEDASPLHATPTGSEAGDGTFSFRVRVVEESEAGPPVPGATIVVAHTDAKGEPIDPTVAVIAGPDGEGLAHVDPLLEYAVIARRGDDFTVETVPGVRAGAAGEEKSVVVSLFHSRKSASWVAPWPGPADPNAAKYTGVGSTKWMPESPIFANDTAIEEGYVSRLVLLDVTVTWTNTPTTYGDFGVGASAREDYPDVFQDAEYSEPADGENRERLVLAARNLVDSGLRKPQPLYVGPATEAVFVGLDGMDVRVQVEATFSTISNEDIPGTPAPGALAAALAAVLALAVAARRRPQP